MTATQNVLDPAAMAIPKEGYFELIEGPYGPLFPKTPANYGFLNNCFAYLCRNFTGFYGTPNFIGANACPDGNFTACFANNGWWWGGFPWWNGTGVFNGNVAVVGSAEAVEAANRERPGFLQVSRLL